MQFEDQMRQNIRVCGTYLVEHLAFTVMFAVSEELFRKQETHLLKLAIYQ